MIIHKWSILSCNFTYWIPVKVRIGTGDIFISESSQQVFLCLMFLSLIFQMLVPLQDVIINIAYNTSLVRELKELSNDIRHVPIRWKNLCCMQVYARSKLMISNFKVSQLNFIYLSKVYSWSGWCHTCCIQYIVGKRMKKLSNDVRYVLIWWKIPFVCNCVQQEKILSFYHKMTKFLNF